MAEVVPLASFDADEVREYEIREERREGDGDRFHEELQRGFLQLAKFPHSGARIKGTIIRRLLVCGGRFGIIYVPEARGVILHALLDHLADPAFNARRIREITRLLNQQ